jgi:hypothetical protein
MRGKRGSQGEQLANACVEAAGLLRTRVREAGDDVAELLREEVPAHAAEDRDTLRQNIRAVLDIVLARLERGEAPDETDARAIGAMARRWAAEDRTLDQRSVQLGVRLGMGLVADNASELGLDHRTLFPMQDAMWEWATTCSLAFADAQRDHEVAVARHDAARRAGFLRDLAAGAMSLKRLARECEAQRIDIERRHFVLRAEWDAGASSAAIEAHIRRSAATAEPRAVEVILDGQLIAVSPQPPGEIDGWPSRSDR